MRLPIEPAYPPKARPRAVRPKAWAFALPAGAEDRAIVWRPVERLMAAMVPRRPSPPKPRHHS